MGRGRIRPSRELSADNVFARMKPGRTYSAYIIAAKFHVPTKAVRPFLNELITRGSIKYSHALTNTLGFQRPGQIPEKEAPAPALDTSIAAAPTPPNLNSALTGYEREIRSRVELCMMTRTR